MTALYIITKIITLPMSYLKSLWEHITCVILRLAIEHKECIKMDETCGHVEHRLADKKASAYFVCAIPSFVMFLVALVTLAAGAIPLFYLGTFKYLALAKRPLVFWLYVVFVYLGGSALCNMFPMVEDVLKMREKIYGKDGANLFVKIILFLPFLWLTAGAYLEKYCVTFLLTAGAIAAGFILL
ncbi:MAG: hypothetical protein K5756_02565 [Clostridiales bacterium]|nr:hypothetical protein [Clostridiales bacterium]